MSQKLSQEELQPLLEGLLSLETADECYRFLQDLCTIQEIKAMSQRLEVARLLRQNITYQEISERTGASTATISRVGRALNYGADGYDVVLERLKDREKEVTVQ